MWVIETTDTFDEWFDALDDTDRANVLASMMVLRDRGPMLSRPYADTVNGSILQQHERASGPKQRRSYQSVTFNAKRKGDSSLRR